MSLQFLRKSQQHPSSLKWQSIANGVAVMTIQSRTVAPRQPRFHVRSTGFLALQPHQRPILIRFTIVLLGCLTACIAIVMAVTRMGSGHPVVDPPPSLLPGSILPAGARCGPTLAGTAGLECHIHLRGKDISLGTHQSLIAATKLSGYDTTLGDLILTWGTPTNIAQSGRVFQVSWGRNMPISLPVPCNPVILLS